MFTKTPGIGGHLRQRIEDFQVDEIPKKVVPGDEYTIFWLEKFNWDSNRAIEAISNRLHVSIKRFGVAGTKDRRAVTRQRVSVWRIEPAHLENVKIRDIKLYGFEKSAERINLGDSEGNRFVITIRDLDLPEDEIRKRIGCVFSELGKGIPNIYGTQRFGEVRTVTSDVGRAMLRGDFEGAVKIYLAKVFDSEPEDSKEARKYLNENWGTKKAYVMSLGTFPERLHFERAMLDSLVEIPTDFSAALRRLPKRLRRMFINAVQSEIFNEAVEWYVKKHRPTQQDIPLIGYDTVFDEKNPIHKKIIEIMEREKIELEAFKMPRSPDLAITGSQRPMLLVPNDMKIVEIKNDDFNEGKMKATVSFELPPGAYATVVLAELMKDEK